MKLGTSKRLCGVIGRLGSAPAVVELSEDIKYIYILCALQEHSACAWEITRVEVRDNLVQFKKFLDSRVKP